MAATRRLLAILASFACAASAASVRADVFMLASGGQVEGTLLPSTSATRDQYLVKTDVGAVVTLAKSQVKEVIRRKPEEAEYEKTRHQYPDTVEGQWNLAEWCREHSLAEQRKTHLRRVIELDADHAAARAALGYSKFDGEWKTSEEHMSERGFVKYLNRWRLPQEVTIMEEQHKNEVAEKAWFNNLRRWREWLNGPRADEAARMIREIKDPLAIAPLKRFLESDPNDQVRILAAEALANIGTGSAISALAHRSLEDASDEVRLSCIDLIDNVPRPEVVQFFIQRLHDADNKVVNRAAIGLARMKDRSAIPPLVDALVTTHKFKVISGQAPGAMSASFGSGGTGFGMGGNKPTIITQELQNAAVLDALVTLVPNVNFAYDEAAWKKWLANERRNRSFDPRRG